MSATELHAQRDNNPDRIVALDDVVGAGLEFDATHAAIYVARLAKGLPVSVKRNGVSYRPATAAEKTAAGGTGVPDYNNFPGAGATAGDADTFDWVRTTGNVMAVNTKEEMAGVDRSGFLAVILTQPNTPENWIYKADDLSAEVAADPFQGWLVAPSDDPTGASGAWEADFQGKPFVEWWDDGGNDQGLAFTRAFAAGATMLTANPNTGLDIRTPIDFTSSENSPRGFDAPFTALRNYVVDSMLLFSSWVNSKFDCQIRSQAGAGYVIDNQGTARSVEMRIRSYNNSTDASRSGFIRADNTPAQKTHLQSCNIQIDIQRSETNGHDPQPGAPLIDINTDQTNVRNTKIEVLFGYPGSTAPAWQIKNTDNSGSVNYGNTYIYRAIETAVMGSMVLAGEWKPVIEIGSFDVTTMLNHALVLTAEDGGEPCEFANITYHRRAGDLNGFHDIFLENAPNATINAVGQNLGLLRLRVDTNFFPCKVINSRFTEYLNQGVGFQNQDVDRFQNDSQYINQISTSTNANNYSINKLSGDGFVDAMFENLSGTTSVGLDSDGYSGGLTAEYNLCVQATGRYQIRASGLPTVTKAQLAMPGDIIRLQRIDTGLPTARVEYLVNNVIIHTHTVSDKPVPTADMNVQIRASAIGVKIRKVGINGLPVVWDTEIVPVPNFNGQYEDADPVSDAIAIDLTGIADGTDTEYALPATAAVGDTNTPLDLLGLATPTRRIIITGRIDGEDITLPAAGDDPRYAIQGPFDSMKFEYVGVLKDNAGNDINFGWRTVS